MENIEELKPWIDIEVNIRYQPECLESLKKDLQELGSVHIHKKWHAACGSDGLFIFFKFGIEAIASYLFVETLKTTLSRFISILKKYTAQASEPLDMSGISLQYDNISFSFIDILASDLAHVSAFMNNLPKHLEVLENLGIQDIEIIELLSPDTAEINNDKGEHWPEWQVTYDFGMNSVSYDALHKKLINN